VVDAEVPRHEFIPELVWRYDRDTSAYCDLVPLRRCDDPQGWLERAYANALVNTQVDDGHPIGEAGRGFEVTSSASMPGVVAQMLAALDVEPGMRVLEIGTGTGYNTALLAHRLGAGNIVSVEVDPAVAGHARRALAATGFGAVTVVTADGEDPVTTSTTDLHPWHVAGDVHVSTAIGLRGRPRMADEPCEPWGLPFATLLNVGEA
jgi:protein-L-isoaspartate O-methyltransferase